MWFFNYHLNDNFEKQMVSLLHFPILNRFEKFIQHCSAFAHLTLNFLQIHLWNLTIPANLTKIRFDFQWTSFACHVFVQNSVMFLELWIHHIELIPEINFLGKYIIWNRVHIEKKSGLIFRHKFLITFKN